MIRWRRRLGHSIPITNARGANTANGPSPITASRPITIPMFSFLVACTFADVIMGSIPLIWDIHKSLVGNSARLIAATTILFVFNVIRLEIGQILYSYGVSWTFADQVLGGISYFLVWLVIWQQRTWRVFKRCPVPSSVD